MTIQVPRNNASSTAVNCILLACTTFLAIEPAAWLLRTWFDASWGSYGEFAFCAVVGLFIWSATSRRRDASPSAVPALLFAATAAVRVAGHVLAVNVIGALALVIDVFALGLLFGLHRRERAVSPFWLAALFALALPLERIVQRVVGFGLQQISAAGACGALTVGFDDVKCAGVDIVLAGQHVLVDLPCSGARGLLLITAAFVVLAALSRPTLRHALVGMATTVMAALVSNTVRIVLLAVGIAFADVVGVDVMAQPWHDIIGLFTLGLGLLPVVLWYRPRSRSRDPQPAQTSKSSLIPTTVQAPVIAAVLVLACVVVVFTPHQPVDVARPVYDLETPTQLAGVVGQRLELSARERDYFTQFGGAAAKARFGARTLLMVRTSAPLRHLHAPDECLTGAGFDVERVGVSHGVMSGATYRAVAPDGQVWRVIVTYRSDAGHTATSVSEAVWLWLRHPETTWTAIERAHPWGAPIAANEAFDEALTRTLDLHP